MSLQYGELVAHRRGVAEHVAGIRVASNEIQGALLASTADKNRDGAADRSGHVVGVGEGIVLAFNAALLMVNQGLADTECLVEAVESLACAREGHAIRGVLVSIPGCTQTKDGSATRDHVESRHCLGKQAWVAQRDRTDQGIQLHRSRPHGQGAEQGVRLEHRRRGATTSAVLMHVIWH